ncbi:hypothetical protein ACLB2K_044287 [Fragaria x ananassa]
MASPITNPIAKQVSNAFARQYYYLWENSPDQVYRFYKDCSKLIRPEDNGTMSTTTTIEKIKDKLLALRRLCTWRSLHLVTVDEHSCITGGVFVVATGYTTEKDGQKKKFIQKFFLAPQAEGGYFLESDMVEPE